MPIITISRGSYFHGKSIAEKLAERLGYHCVARDEIIDGLKEFHLPEIKLVRNLNDAFRVLERFPNGKKRFVSAISAALLKCFQQENVIYHGLVGHHFVKDISHVLKVRIIADTESRVKREMEHEQISAEKARYILKKDDEERRRWCMFLYGIDIFNPAPYNLVIRVGHLSEEDVVNIIAEAVSRPSFQETDTSRKALSDAALSAEVSNALFDYPNAAVSTSGSHVRVALKAPEEQSEAIKNRVEALLKTLEGVKQQTVTIDPYF